jgi:hypothetical protein
MEEHGNQSRKPHKLLILEILEEISSIIWIICPVKCPQHGSPRTSKYPMPGTAK